MVTSFLSEVRVYMVRLSALVTSTIFLCHKPILFVSHTSPWDSMWQVVSMVQPSALVTSTCFLWSQAYYFLLSQDSATLDGETWEKNVTNLMYYCHKPIFSYVTRLRETHGILSTGIHEFVTSIFFYCHKPMSFFSHKTLQNANGTLWVKLSQDYFINVTSI